MEVVVAKSAGKGTVTIEIDDDGDDVDDSTLGSSMAPWPIPSVHGASASVKAESRSAA